MKQVQKRKCNENKLIANKEEKCQDCQFKMVNKTKCDESYVYMKENILGKHNVSSFHTDIHLKKKTEKIRFCDF